MAHKPQQVFVNYVLNITKKHIRWILDDQMSKLLYEIISVIMVARRIFALPI